MFLLKLTREKGYLLPTWAQKITCQCFDWMLQSSSGWKWKKCEQTLLIIVMYYWGYTSLEVKGLWGLLLPPCLLITVVQQPGSSNPQSRLKRSSAGVIWMCRAAPSQQLLSSAMVQYGGPSLVAIPLWWGGRELEGGAVMVKIEPPQLVPPITNFLINKDSRNLFCWKIWMHPELILLNPRTYFCKKNLDPF